MPQPYVLQGFHVVKNSHALTSKRNNLVIIKWCIGCYNDEARKDVSRLNEKEISINLLPNRNKQKEK